MKKSGLVIYLSLLSWCSYSQTAKDFMIGGALDLIKTNQSGYADRAQGGVEVNYFFFRKFTGTAGFEYWTEEREPSLVVGGRWFPVPEAYVRLRGLIGANDISIGGGWAKPYSENWRFEAMGDVYLEGHIAIRAGIAYVFRRNPD